jgi:hypothetical protein
MALSYARYVIAVILKSANESKLNPNAIERVCQHIALTCCSLDFTDAGFDVYACNHIHIASSIGPSLGIPTHILHKFTRAGPNPLLQVI